MSTLVERLREFSESLRRRADGLRRQDDLGCKNQAAAYALIADELDDLRATTGEGEWEPIGWVFQHDETGRMAFCENDGVNSPETFASSNPRYALCGPAYSRLWSIDEAVDRAISWFAKADPEEARLSGVSKDCNTSRQFFRELLVAAAPPPPLRDAGDAFCDGNCVWTDHHPDCPNHPDRLHPTPAEPTDEKGRPLTYWGGKPAEPLRDAGAVLQRHIVTKFRDGSVSVEDITAAHPAPAQVDETRVLAALGHEPQVSDRCTARVVPTPPEKRPPGPSDLPIWCHLKAGHDGPHRCNHGGGYRSFPFRKSDPVEFREPVTICAKCRTRWPCPEAEKVSAALAAAAKEGKS